MPKKDLELEEPYPGHLKDLLLAWSALGWCDQCLATRKAMPMPNEVNPMEPAAVVDLQAEASAIVTAKDLSQRDLFIIGQATMERVMAYGLGREDS